MHFRISGLVFSFFFFFFLFDTPTALLLPNPSTRPALAESNQPQRLALSRSTQEISLQPRQIIDWSGFGYGRFITAVVAVGVAATVIIIRLLSNIVDSCINIWAYSRPYNQVVIEGGSMRLEFGCAMEPVPWEFIAEWANSRNNAVKRGFAPVYAKEWWFKNKDQRRRCYVGIRMVPEGAIPEKPVLDR